MLPPHNTVCMDSLVPGNVIVEIYTRTSFWASSSGLFLRCLLFRMQQLSHQATNFCLSIHNYIDDESWKTDLLFLKNIDQCGLSRVICICHVYCEYMYDVCAECQDTVRCRYNAVNFLKYKVSFGGSNSIIDILLWSLHWCVQYHVILDRVIAASNRITLSRLIVYWS